jgi:transglutaminase-like putative cysteine protease/glutamine cyclotransferase
MKILAATFFLICWTTLLWSYPGKVVQQFPAPAAHGTGLTFDGQNLWSADHKTDKLYCLDPKTGMIIREIPSPGFWPMDLAWDGKYLWNIDIKLKKIFKIRPEDGRIMLAIDAPSENPEGLTWDGKTLWISDSKENKIMKLDLSDGTALRTFTSPARGVQGLTFDGKYLWCSDRMMDELYVLNPEDGEVIFLVKSPGQYPRGLAWDGQYIWNLDYQTDQIYQLIRQDQETFRLDNTRKARITLTHEVKITGKGLLKNLDVFLAIPENMPQQLLLSKEFVPATYQVVTDRWNQNFSKFNYQNIDASTVTQTTMVIDAEISEIYYYLFPDQCGTLQDIPKEIKKLYTADGSKYLLADPFIKDLATKLVGDEKNPYWMARKIFDYVRNTLEYHLEGGWNVAPFVLKRGTGSCSEYTFSFIALCRAAGIPARYVGAIVVRGDDASIDEVFHRWPEVYLPNYGWIPMDPQGGDKPLARDRVLNIGHLSNRFLITTQGGGDSEYMGWYYNSYETFETDPQVMVNIETFGDWQPLEK